MKNNRFLNYIDKVGELKFYEDLKQYIFKSFGETEKDILTTLLNQVDIKSAYYTTAQAAFFDITNSVLNTVVSEGKVQEFLELIKQYSESDSLNINFLIGRFILNIKDDVHGIRRISHISEIEEQLREINRNKLQGLIDANRDYYAIVQVLYNCIADMKLPDRLIILDKEAIAIFKSYLNTTPRDYITHFIRPYYNGPNKNFIEYFVHVGEPFNEQIFPESDDFLNFLNGASNHFMDTNLVEDVKMFYERVNSGASINEKKTTILYSTEIEESFYKNIYNKLLSPNHVWARPECLPPDYK